MKIHYKEFYGKIFFKYWQLYTFVFNIQNETIRILRILFSIGVKKKTVGCRVLSIKVNQNDQSNI